MTNQLAASAPDDPPSSGQSVWRNADFILFLTVRTLTSLSFEIVTVAVGWWIYDISRDPFDLGLVGLTQLLPALLLFLVTGAIADRYPRSKIVGIGLFMAALCGVGLLLLSLSADHELLHVFLLMLLLGICRAFFNTAQQAMLPSLVPRDKLARAISVSTTVVKTGVVVGPMAGGLLYGLSPAAAFAVASVFLAGGSVASFLISQSRVVPSVATSRSLLAGLDYIWNHKVLLGAMSLDMVSTLLGGAMALLPVFARDVLHAGPVALGLLRSAYAVGSIATAAYLSWRPLRDHAGLWMLFAVAGFGASTVIFGLSTSVWLSAFALAFMGGIDMINVTIRQIIIQLWTPDEMRGRVSAANSVFVGVSNEAGEFRAGTVAALIGAVPAVVVGGVGAVAAAALWARWFPELRKIRYIDR
jgi:MFS family permease